MHLLGKKIGISDISMSQGQLYMLLKQLLFGFFKTAIFWHKGFVCCFLETQDAPSLILWMKLQLQPMFMCEDSKKTKTTMLPCLTHFLRSLPEIK